MRQCLPLFPPICRQTALSRPCQALCRLKRCYSFWVPLLLLMLV